MLLDKIANLYRPIIYILIAAGIFFRFWDIDAIGFWLDEIFTASFYSPFYLNDTWEEFWHILTYDVHPPLYPLVSRYWMTVFGDSEVPARMLSVFFGVTAVFSAYFFAKKFFSPDISLVYTVLVSCSFVNILYSQDARMYPLAIFFSTISTPLFVWMANKARNGELIERKVFAWLAILALLSCYTHYYAAVYHASIYIILFFIFLKYRRSIVPLIFSGLSVFILFLPWIIIHALKTRSNKRHFVNDVEDVMPSVFQNIFGADSLFVTAIFLIIPIFAMLSYFLHRGDKNKAPFEETYLIILIIFSISTILLISHFVRPILHHYRYFSMFLPAFYLVVAISLFRGGFSLKIGSVELKKLYLIICIIISMSTWSSRGVSTYKEYHMRDSANFIKSRKECEGKKIFAVTDDFFLWQPALTYYFGGIVNPSVDFDTLPNYQRPMKKEFFENMHKNLDAGCDVALWTIGFKGELLWKDLKTYGISKEDFRKEKIELDVTSFSREYDKYTWQFVYTAKRIE